LDLTTRLDSRVSIFVYSFRYHFTCNNTHRLAYESLLICTTSLGTETRYRATRQIRFVVCFSRDLPPEKYQLGQDPSTELKNLSDKEKEGKRKKKPCRRAGSRVEGKERAVKLAIELCPSSVSCMFSHHRPSYPSISSLLLKNLFFFLISLLPDHLFNIIVKNASVHQSFVKPKPKDGKLPKPEIRTRLKIKIVWSYENCPRTRGN